MKKLLEIKFICNVYQHTINGDGDWDGYETQWTIKAQTLEEAEELLWKNCNMHTEPSDFIEFIDPITNERHKIDQYTSIKKEIGEINRQIRIENEKELKLLEIAKIAKEKFLISLKIAQETTRATFLDREMAYLLKF